MISSTAYQQQLPPHRHESVSLVNTLQHESSTQSLVRARSGQLSRHRAHKSTCDGTVTGATWYAAERDPLPLRVRDEDRLTRNRPGTEREQEAGISAGATWHAADGTRVRGEDRISRTGPEQPKGHYRNTFCPTQMPTHGMCGNRYSLLQSNEGSGYGAVPYGKNTTEPSQRFQAASPNSRLTGTSGQSPPQ